MATESKRATIYFDPGLHRVFTRKSVETYRSVSGWYAVSVLC